MDWPPIVLSSRGPRLRCGFLRRDVPMVDRYDMETRNGSMGGRNCVYHIEDLVLHIRWAIFIEGRNFVIESLPLGLLELGIILFIARIWLLNESEVGGGL